MNSKKKKKPYQLIDFIMDDAETANLLQKLKTHLSEKLNTLCKVNEVTFNRDLSNCIKRTMSKAVCDPEKKEQK